MQIKILPLVFILVVSFSNLTIGPVALSHIGQVVTRNVSLSGGNYFDNIVFVAMENQFYADVMGNGTGSLNSPFISSLLPYSVTIPHFHAYGADNRTINHCSAGCYLALLNGYATGGEDYCPISSSPCLNIPNLMGELNSSGLSWAAFCEDKCTRGANHFPFIAYNNTWNNCVVSFFTCNGPNIFNTNSTMGNSEFISYVNSPNPANLIWFTPSDRHNMHDNGITGGDSYVQNLLVGNGTLFNPDTNSLLASNLFRSNQRTLLVLWWDEYDPAPILFYGPNIGVKQGYISSSNHFDHYSILRMIEDNWNLPTLTGNDLAATGLAGEMFLASFGQGPLLQPLAMLPTGLGAESIVVHNGDLYVGTISFTNPNGTILVYEKDGTLTQTFTIPALPQVGELLFADDHSLYAVAANIVNGQGSLVQLDTQTGNVTTIANGFSFPNGMVRDRFGNLFVTDLTAGTVTKVGSDGTISLFASSPLLTAAPIPGTGLSLGANDLTMDQKETALYVTNVGQNIVVKIAIQKNGSPGTITRFANIPTPDGITFDKQEGLLLVTSPFTNSIWTITRDGVSQQLSLNNALAQLNNPSNLIFQGHRLYITNLALGGTGSIVTVKLLPSDDD